jgi:hypothetical protein
MARGLLFGPGAFFFGKYKNFFAKFIEIYKNPKKFTVYYNIRNFFWRCFIFKLGCLVGVLYLEKKGWFCCL